MHQVINAETTTSLELNLFSFFICCCQHQRKTICFYVYISDITQTVRYWTPVFTQPFLWRLHITITYLLPHLRLWYADVVTVITQTQEVVCQGVQTSRHEKDGTWSELTWFETTYWSSSFRGEDLWKSLRGTTDDDGHQVMAIAHMAPLDQVS